MSTNKAKAIKMRKKSMKRKSLTGSVRQKKRERSEIRKKSVTTNKQGTSKAASMSSLEEDECLSPVLEEYSQQPNTTLNDIYDPALMFPCSNKPHETRQKTIAEESKQWESFFDPQHTFGPFHSTIKKHSNEHFYRGKWPLDQEDLMGIVPKPKRQSEAGDTTMFLFPTVPDPTLPNTDNLEIHTTALEDEEFDGNVSIEILPCPSLSSFPKLKKTENETLWKKRLELLSTIQKNVFDEKWNGTQQAPFKESTKARLQKHIKDKAEKIKRETLVDSSTEEEEDESEDEKVVPAQSFAALEPDTKQLGLEDLGTPQSSLICLDDSWEKISFSPPKEDVESQKVVEVKRKNRPSFLLFAYGFLFPPLWIIGAFYHPPSSVQRTTASKKIDMKWRKYSRNAFFVFFCILVVIVVLILVLKPEAVGFRNSNSQGYQNEENIIFDDRPIQS